MLELNDDPVNPVKKTIHEIKLPQNLTTSSIWENKFLQKLFFRELNNATKRNTDTKI